MSIKKNDGQDIINFIENTLNIKLPNSGFLAGQSVCSALLYLHKKSIDFHVNDIDIFLPKHILTQKELFYFNNKQQSLLQNTTGNSNGINDLNISVELDNPYLLISEKEKYKKKLSIIQQKVITSTENYKQYLTNNNAHFTNADIESYSKKSNRFLQYDFGLSNNLHDTKKINFFLRKEKRIFDSKKIGIFNYIYVNTNIHRGDFFEPNILADFDINCTQIGVDLFTKKIFFTKEFLYFYNTLHLEIINADTPYHSIIRYFKKMQEFKFNGSLEFESFYIDNQLKHGLFSQKDKNPNYSDFKVKKNCFGNIYLDKINQAKKVLDFFNLIELKSEKNKVIEFRKSKNLSFKDYPLFQLKGNCDDFEYISSGKHLQDFQKNSGFTIEHGYHSYLHLNMKKIIKDNHNYNKKTYSTLHSFSQKATTEDSLKMLIKLSLIELFDLNGVDNEKIEKVINILYEKKSNNFTGFIVKFEKFEQLYKIVDYFNETHSTTNVLKVKKMLEKYSLTSLNRVSTNHILSYIKKRVGILEIEHLSNKNKLINAIFKTDFQATLINGYEVSPINSLYDLESLSFQFDYNLMQYKLSMMAGETQIYLFKKDKYSFFINLNKIKNGHQLIMLKKENIRTSNKDEIMSTLNDFYKTNNIKKCCNYNNILDYLI